MKVQQWRIADMTGVSSTAMALAAIFAVAWLAYFYMSSELGLYQDDVFMYHIVQHARSGIIREAFDFARGYGGEGRQGSQVIMVLFAALGKQLGGVTGLYVVCWILLCIQAGFAFLFFRHFFSHQASFLAAAFLALFPADAAKFFAVSYMGIISHTLFLVAAIFAVRGHNLLSAATMVLLATIGEPYIPMGFLLPLAILAYNRNAWRKAIQFWVIYLLMALCYVGARLVYAPGRARDVVGSKDRIELIQRMFESMYHGVAASAASFHKRIPELIAQGGSSAWTIAAIVFAILAFALFFRDRQSPGPPVPSLWSIDARPSVAATMYLVVFGVLACFAAYPLYGMYPPRFPPTIIDGKLSNIHGTAGVGFATLLGVVLHEFETRAAARTALLIAGRMLLVAYLSLTAGYFALVQKRYVDSWRYQLAFFRHLPDAVPNLHAGSLVVVESYGLDATRLEGGSPFDWTLPHLMPFMWRVPPGWPNSPFVISRYFFETNGRPHGEYIDIVGYPTLPSRSFLQRDVVKLKVQNGRLFAADPGKSEGQERSFDLSDEPPAPKAGFQPGEFQLRARGDLRQTEMVISPNNYTGGGWHNGVREIEGNDNDMFYFLVSSESLNPITTGDTVKFARAGTATVIRVDVAKQGEMTAVFVQVNRDLDPRKDGFPNSIRVLRP